jgi:hypothetical protein
MDRRPDVSKQKGNEEDEEGEELKFMFKFLRLLVWHRYRTLVPL